MSSNNTASVLMYSTPFCPYCIRAKMLLDSLNTPYTDIDVSRAPQKRQEMMDKSGRRTVPQIWIGAQHIGGYDDIAALHRAGKLEPLLFNS